MGFKKLLLLAIVILLFFATLQINSSNKTTISSFPTPIPTSTKYQTFLKWGVYAGPSVNNAIDFEKKVGRHPNFLPVFIHWGNENQLPYQFTEYAVMENQTLVIYWEAMDYRDEHPENNELFSYDQILKGTWDKYIKQFASSLKNYGHPVILVPFEEMNGDWYPWSITKNGNTPVKHISAYRYIHQFFNNVSNVKFAWTINSDTVPDTLENQPVTYYPGDNYVDYLGVNGFNFDNPWKSFSEVFSNPFNSLSKINKPIIITSMASAPGSKKAEWIKNAAEQISKNKQIIGWIWFNENKERDWRIWSDYESLQAFQKDLTTIAD